MKTNWMNGVLGAFAGLAGAWTMQRFRVLWEARESSSQESGIFGFDEEADLNSVDRLCDLLLLPAVSKDEALRSALVLHYVYGAVAGVAYGAIRAEFSEAKAGSGLLFGTALWLVGDEIAVSLAGLSHPGKKTASSHLSALFAHLLFGFTTELTLKSFSKTVR